MKELTIFEFQGNNLRVIEHNGNPWFIANEVCQALGISNSWDAITRVSDHQRDALGITDAIGRIQKTNIVSEGGLYKLAFQSRKPEAQAFTDKVVDEILPAIRKTGSYSVQQVRELDPIETAKNPQMLRQAVEQLEDIALAAAKKAQLFKLLEQHYYPEQYRTRGKRTLPQARPVVWNNTQLTQLTIIFEIA